MRNEDILAPLMPEIGDLRTVGVTWREIGRLLNERGIVSSSGLSFSPSALRAYCSNFARSKDVPLSERLDELGAALKAERDARIAAEFQRDRIAALVAEYLISRIQWSRGVLSRGKRDIGYGWVNHQRKAWELREWIEAISPAAGKVADDAGALVTVLALDIAGQSPEQISGEELTELRFSDADLTLLLQQQYFAANQDWGLSMAAATPRS